MTKSERPTVPLTAAEKAELLALAKSAELRKDLRSGARKREASIDEYIAFVTGIARLSNHARRPFRPMIGNHFML